MMKRQMLLIVATIFASSCAPHRPPAHTVLPPQDSGFSESEDEMDLTIPSFNPLTASGTAADPINLRFRGADRKGPKTSIVSARREDFVDLAALAGTLPADDAMLNHTPTIARNTMTRAVEENRNVRVPAWIYAIKFEADDDWHVILGSDPSGTTQTFFNGEVSGLPLSSSPDFLTLLKVRKSLAKILSKDLPTGSGYNKYEPPLPVTVEGSLFFDVDHAAGVVGPTGMRPQTAWEIHPITKLSAR